MPEVFNSSHFTALNLSQSFNKVCWKFVTTNCLKFARIHKWCKSHNSIIIDFGENWPWIFSNLENLAEFSFHCTLHKVNELYWDWCLFWCLFWFCMSIWRFSYILIKVYRFFIKKSRKFRINFAKNISWGAQWFKLTYLNSNS